MFNQVNLHDLGLDFQEYDPGTNRTIRAIFCGFSAHFMVFLTYKMLNIYFRYKNRLGKSFIIGWSNRTNAKTVTKPKEFSMPDKFTSFNTE